jgi:hypothetical protein
MLKMFYREWYIDKGKPKFLWRFCGTKKGLKSWQEERTKHREWKRDFEKRYKEKKELQKSQKKKAKKLDSMRFPELSEGRLARWSIKFHDRINSAVGFLYKEIRRIDYSVPRDEALKNLDKFAREVEDRTRSMRINEGKEKTLEERLATLGKHYIPFEQFEEASPQLLFDLACVYDEKGIVAKRDEKLRDLTYRGNTMLFVHRTFKKEGIKPKVELDTKDWDVTVHVKSGDVNLLKQEDIEEANSRIPYGMDLSWIAGFIGDDNSGILSGAYGVCFTLPKYGGLNFLLMRDRYKSREAFLKVLSHEMAHMGTVYLDTRRDFLETKAYAAGSAAFGEYTIALNQRPNLLLRICKALVKNYFPVSETAFKVLPKILSAVKIAENRRVYSNVRDRLHTLYGEDNGNYILGRLMADEIEEFGYTNNIPARIDEKRDLKWEVIKRKIGTK